MQRTDELRQAAEAWADATHRLVRSAGAMSPLTDSAYVAASIEPDVEAQAERVVDAANGVFEHLAPQLDGDDDPEVREATLAFLVANLSAADAVLTAGNTPNAIVAELRLDNIRAFPTETWERDIDLALAALGGAMAVGGAQTDDALPSLDSALDSLINASGDELVNIGTDGVFVAALPHLAEGAEALLGGTLGAIFDDVRDQVHGFWAKAKRAASRLVQWAISRAGKLLPPAVRTAIANLFAQVKDEIASRAGHLVGEIAAVALGLHSVQSAWAEAAPDVKQRATNHLADATRDELRRIGEVTKGRTFIEKWVKRIGGLVTTVPQASVAIAAAAVAAMLFVLFELWEGLRDLRELVGVGPPVPQPIQA